jgi:hypothetical protein
VLISAPDYRNDMTSDCGTGASFCTWADPTLAQFGAPLPPALGGGTGLALTLSQEPCDNQGCCQNGVCANWAGAHLVSSACFLYGTVEFEASILGFPAATNGVFYVGTRVTAPNQDLEDSQNEIDIGMAPSTLQPLPSPGGQQHSHDVAAVAGSGPELMLAYFGPSLSASSYDQDSTPQFTQAQANAFTTYKFVWGPGSLDFYVDGQLYRSVRTQTGAPSALRDMNVPWRPQDLRLIVRTNVGTSVAAPAGTVYMRSLTVTPAGATPGAQAPQQAPAPQAVLQPVSVPPPVPATPLAPVPPPVHVPVPQLPPTPAVVAAQPPPAPPQLTAAQVQHALKAQALAQAKALATAEQQCLQLCQAQLIPAQNQACTGNCTAQYTLLMGQINPALLPAAQAAPAATPAATLTAVAVPVAVVPVAAPLAAPAVGPAQYWEAVPSPPTVVAPLVVPTPAPLAVSPVQYWEAVPSPPPPPRKVLAAAAPVAEVEPRAATDAVTPAPAPQATAASVDTRTGLTGRFMLRPLR